MVGFFHRSLTFEDLEVKGDGKVDTEFGVFCWMLREWDVRVIVLLMTEILRSPVEVGSYSHSLQGFRTIPSLLAGYCEASTVGFLVYSKTYQHTEVLYGSKDSSAFSPPKQDKS